MRAPVDIVEVYHPLTVGVNGSQYGSIYGLEGAISCGLGQLLCNTKVLQGSSVRLAALRGEAGTFVMWLGCDRTLGMACFVDMPYGRTVAAWFSYDFIGQWEPPPDGLFSRDRKAEIAENGARAATEGAVGCLGSAVLIGSASRGSTAVGAAGVATRWQAFALKVFQETVGNCAKGVFGTIANGVLLKVDPPDPQWRQLALAEPMPRPRSVPCPLPRGCGTLNAARTRLAAADRRVLELQEALAVAANRYGNAVGANDRPIAGAARGDDGRDERDARGRLSAAKRGVEVARLRPLRSAGIRKLVIPQKLMAASMKRVKAGTRRAEGRDRPHAATQAHRQRQGPAGT